MNSLLPPALIEIFTGRRRLARETAAMVTTRSLVGGAASIVACDDCAAPLAWDQRYCVECGSRRGELPVEFSAMISGSLAAAPADAASRPAVSGWLAGLVLPTPRVVAAATMCVLAFGVAVGRAATPPSRTDGMSSLVAAALPSILGIGRTAPGPAAAPVRAPAAPASVPTPTPAVTPAAAPAPVAPAPAPAKAAPKASPAPTAPVAAPPLPSVNHVFLIVLSDHGVDAAFGPGGAAPYLSTTLRQQGELLPNYYAVAQGELANEIALISGQGPTPQTAADCQQYLDLTPGTVGADGQAAGTGCVYPTPVKTVADELAAGTQVWKAYAEDSSNGGPGQPTTCRHPAPGAADPWQTPVAGDAFETWRDPFVYFHSLIDAPTCAADVVGLDQLAPDLAATGKAPTLAYIVPNACHDGSETPCAPGQPAGLAAADAWLRTVVPEITGSAAYKDGGLIAITFDQAPQTGPGADASACCLTPTAYPNLAPGTAPGAPTTPTTTTPTTPTTPTVSTTTPPPYVLPVPTTTTPPAGGATTPTAGAAAPATTFLLPPKVTAAGGGGRVGLLLLSPFVKAGSINSTAYNHYSLLASIQDLFQLPNIGYAGLAGLPVFDASVYNAKP